MKKRSSSPPSYFLRFFRWFCHPELQPYVEGDLMELYEERVKESGERKANWRFIIDVLLLFRPSMIRPDLLNPADELNPLNQYAMFRNYFKVGIRNILRHKVFSLINITGLGVGMACCVLIMLYVKDELSYDHYHKNFNQIYRVLHAFRNAENPENLPSPAPEEFQVWGCAPVGEALLADFPEVKSVFQFTSPATLLLQHGDVLFQEDNMVYADSTAFAIFSWKLVEGNAETALKAPNSIVLTESTAKKYFGDSDPLGQTLTVNKEGAFEVTGVMEDVPSNSHFTFDGLISMTTFRTTRPDVFGAWGYVDFYTYFLVDEHTDLAALKAKIPDFIERQLPNRKDYTITFEPLADAYLHSKAGRQPGTTGSLSNVYIFSAIAVFILLIACINFMNLSTARSMERAKEVGVRKSVGAQQYALIYQFLSESVLLSFLAALLAIALMILAFPRVREISGKSFTYETLLAWEWLPFLVGGVIFIGLLAGTYPAWILSRFHPTLVLKGKFRSTSKGVALRKGLVVFQFAISMALIVGTGVVYSQLNFLRSHDLGYKQEQMLVIDFGWDNEVQNQIATIKTEYLRNAGVLSVSASRAVPGNFFPNAYTGVEPPDGEMIYYGPALYEIDEDFIPTYGMEMAAGRAFSREFPTDSTQSLILNEAAAKLYGYADPEEIIGKRFAQWGREGTVVGVVKDFNYKSLHEEVEPLTLRFGPIGSLRNLSLRLKSEDMPATMVKLEQLWKELAPQRPFLYSFLDDSFNRQYQADVRFGNIFTVFASLAIFIACLGLFGLTTYTTEQRIKEIGIRKVLGASVASIVALLSRDFIMLFLFALIVAVPVSWYVMNHWLEGFAYRVGIGVGIFVLAGLITITIALATISWQSIKAALRNPVNALKSE